MSCSRKAGAAIFCTCGLAIEMKRARPSAVPRRRRGAERRDGVAPLGLRERHDVHVALAPDDVALCANGIARLDQAVELPAFLEQGGLGRVQVLRLAIAHPPPAEADHRAA